jgi:hypothetical protein
MDSRYIFDTNVWIDVCRGLVGCRDLREKAGSGLVLSPFTITELVRGTVKAGEASFARDQQMFRCMIDNDPEILELSRVFIHKILWNLEEGVSGVHPRHYSELLEMLITSRTHSEFLRRAEAPGSSWTKMTQLHSIHESVLDKELKSLEPMAQKASLRSLSVHFSRMYAFGGLIPDPGLIELRFSAAMEFLRNSILKVRHGAKPWKNDRGSYVDSQFF